MSTPRTMAAITAISVALAIPALGSLAAVPVAAATAGPGFSDATESQVAFIDTAAGAPIRRPEGLSGSASPARVAMRFVEGGGVGSLIPRESLALASVRSSAAGGHVVRLQRSVKGIPIMGGEVVVDLDHSGNIRAASSETTTDVFIPAITVVSAEEASQKAALAIAGDLKVPASTLTTTPAERWIYDPRILGGPGIPEARVVWRTEVTSTDRSDVRQLVLIDAVTGHVALTIDAVAHALDRIVCDANYADARIPCDAPLQTGDRAEGSAPTGTKDTDDAYTYAGDTYDFYARVLGRDSLDGLGMTLRSTVHWRASDVPYRNAFWNGQQMVYGEDMVAKDVVAHELTHGVTEFTSNLYYYYQSGAINESLSDIFGEYVDLSYPGGDDSPEVRWKIGEDLGASLGIIRDMKDPTINDMPDRMGSIFFRVLPEDQGGVHRNSGVGNKLGYLLADGDTFNGYTVTGLGITKAAHIIYGASQLLTSGSDYQAFARALRQSCRSLTGTVGVTEDDCRQVDHAVLATEMDQRSPNGPAAPAPTCTAGASPLTLWSDTMDDSVSGRWTKTSGLDDSTEVPWYYTGETTIYGEPAPAYAREDSANLWGDDPGTVADLRMSMSNPITIPRGQVYLRFNHAFQFFKNAAGRWDGGVVEYSTDGDWVDAGPLMRENGYTSTLSGEGLDNPLGARPAFIDSSRGYTATRLDLSSLAGQDVRFRFRIGSSTSPGSRGWFIDDVTAYACPSTPTIARVISAARALQVTATVPGEQASPVTDVQYRINHGAWKSTGQISGRFTVEGLRSGHRYRVTVRTLNGTAHSGPSASVIAQVR